MPIACTLRNVRPELIVVPGETGYLTNEVGVSVLDGRAVSLVVPSGYPIRPTPQISPT
jgi:hypothetical protein